MNQVEIKEFPEALVLVKVYIDQGLGHGHTEWFVTHPEDEQKVPWNGRVVGYRTYDLREKDEQD